MTLAIVRAPLAVLYVEPLHIVERVDFTERHDLLWAMLRRQTCDRLEWTEAESEDVQASGPRRGSIACGSLRLPKAAEREMDTSSSVVRLRAASSSVIEKRTELPAEW